MYEKFEEIENLRKLNFLDKYVNLISKHLGGREMKKTLLISAISFFLGVFLCALVFVYLPENSIQENYSEEPITSSFTPSLYASPFPQAKPDLDFVQISEKIGPAVVKIECEKVEKVRVRGFWDESPFDPFEDFWDRFFGRPREREREYRSTAQGTGFFISSDGDILTNHHIVENATKVTVFTIEGKEYSAEIKGTDPDTDLALLKVNGKNLHFVEIGDSAKLKVGEWVAAIGNPFGMEHTLTAGIVSAKGRQLGVGPKYQDYIQTDTAINRGNSGGPLVNMKGEVVGITSNILSPSGGNIGIGFAIPANLAKKVVKQLKEKGKVVRGYLGVYMGNITEDFKKTLNLKSKKGALVNEVESGTPAEKAGLKQYDVIIEINGKQVEDKDDLALKVADIEPGTRVNIKVIRDGKEKILTTTIAELKTEVEKEASTASGEDLGISVYTLTPQLARRYGLRTQEGILITKVDSYSQAAKQDIQRGDIIIEVNKRKVTSVRELENIVKKTKPGDPIMLLLRRESDGRVQEFIRTLRIPE